MIWCALVQWGDWEWFWTNISNIPMMSKEYVSHLYLESSWGYIFIYTCICDSSLWLFNVVNEHVIVWWCGWMMNMYVVVWWLYVGDCIYVILLVLYFVSLIYLSGFSLIYVCCCECTPLEYKRSNARIDVWCYRMTLCLFNYLSFGS